ncbi:SIR2 family protein, partial [Microcoleus sp. LEGE 07076]|uniref:SIR2 family protein n=1 Tax=Microcoleus sp. LEGE 07076 TaxID=915322 RepID=UPI001882BCA2|nr:SIR2 family protein [Microcoleus sp. LEGE 07076]
MKRDKGVDFIYQIIKNNFVVESVDPRLIHLYDVPWKRIYTTNYDNAAEIARHGLYAASSITMEDPQSKTIAGSVIHLNGYVKRISPAGLDSELLLTDASYAASRLTDSEWLSFFEHDLTTSRAVVFAGYSLFDLDIDRALLSDVLLCRKTFFFIAPGADRIDVSTIERYGSVIPGGIDALAASISSVRVNYKVPQFPAAFTALRELAPPQHPVDSRPAAQLLLEQLVYGRFPESEILSSTKVFDDQTYLVTREQDKIAQEAIKTGHWRDILFIGEMASGKSASTLTLSAYLRQLGYRVYYAVKHSSLKADLRRISGYEERIAIIFDGYAQFREEITEYCARRQPAHRIVLSESTALHELIHGFIDKTPHLGPTLEVSLDKIAEADIPAFEALTNFGGFWGERAGAGVMTRRGYIKTQLDGSLYRLLIEIIESDKVQRQISELLQPLANDDRGSQVFCSALIVNMLGLTFTISEWQYLFDASIVRRVLAKYGDQLRHFILSDTDRIYVRNGILSARILHAFKDGEIIRNSLIGLYDRAQRSRREEGKWRDINIALVKFSEIEPMFYGATKTSNIFNYYDEIR